MVYIDSFFIFWTKRMWLPKGNPGWKGGGNGLVAVAIDKDKGSQHALRWASENLLSKGQTVVLIHVVHKSSSSSVASRTDVHTAGTSPHRQQQLEKITKDLFLSFHCFCTRKDIHCLDVTLEDSDTVKALTEYVSYAAIENLVLGASSRHGFIRFKMTNIPSSVSKGAPDFCTVYVISKGKISSVRNASRPAPHNSPLLSQIQNLINQHNHKIHSSDTHHDIHPQHHDTHSIHHDTYFHHHDTHPHHHDTHPYHHDTHPHHHDPHFHHHDAHSKHHDTHSKHHDTHHHHPSLRERGSHRPHTHMSHEDPIKSPFTRGGGVLNARSYAELSELDSDISFVSSGRPSTDRGSSLLFDSMCSGRTSCISTNSEQSFGSMYMAPKLLDLNSRQDFSTISADSDRSSGSWSPSQSMHSHDEVEAEMRRLKLELKQTIDMYSTACKEALTAKHRETELNRWRIEEERQLEEARHAEEAALSIAEKERARCKAAMETAEASKRIAELEAQRRVNAEMKALKEAQEMKKVLDNLAHNDVRYRRYSIEEIEAATDYFSENRKIGEGGYGPVYKCQLDHTPVAVKVLRPDAAQGKSQFQKEIEVLSCIRHPNMVLLLGACPEYGCLVYEYMAHGSLEDRIFQHGNTPVLPWQIRFRIAAEIATGLLFLHQTKPEPLVHRDLKPGNILLDLNYVSKISDVGLARLVPLVAENVTQCRMTSTAGTFCFIDPEYQQTGMLGVKSDVYSLGVLLLQLITAKPPMGLAFHAGRAIENGTFLEMLDPAVTNWPAEEALCFAKLAVQCAELRRKDRPDLGSEVLPELERLREIAEENMSHISLGSGPGISPSHSLMSMTQVHSASSKSPSSASSYTGRVSGTAD